MNTRNELGGRRELAFSDDSDELDLRSWMDGAASKKVTKERLLSLYIIFILTSQKQTLSVCLSVCLHLLFNSNRNRTLPTFFLFPLPLPTQLQLRIHPQHPTLLIRAQPMLFPPHLHLQLINHLSHFVSNVT